MSIPYNETVAYFSEYLVAVTTTTKRWSLAVIFIRDVIKTLLCRWEIGGAYSMHRRNDKFI
jgi:hypothetical protein